jgi:ATP-dependent RNA helicase DDX35
MSNSKGFLKPGERRSGAFGVSFVVPEDDRTANHVMPYNKYSYMKLNDQRQKLPIYSYRRDLLYLVERHMTSIVVGETGSGKSTQVPQYLHEAGWAPSGLQIACTQPSRFAAVTVAARVAEEMHVRLGDEVAYAADFEDVSNDAVTKIKFCTDDVLIKEVATDPLLSKYSVVMVDEAHERKVSTDVLLGLLKKIQGKRQLRVIVSSATIHAETFASFFMDEGARTGSSKSTADRPSGMPGLLSVQGRPHGVQVSYLKSPCQDYVRTAIETVEFIHKSDLPGDILVFLTSQHECDAAVEWVKSSATESSRGGKSLFPVALYAGLPAKYQLQVFESAPWKQRKVVFTTEIAETSLTIDGIVHVVDCMFTRRSAFDPVSGVETSFVAPICKMSAIQRSGRAGRVRPGFSFRLCPEDAYKALKDTETPAIQRSDLTHALLQLKWLGIDNILHFPWLSPPPSALLVRSLESLYALGAIGDDARLTKCTGRYMSDLAVICPLLSRCILASWKLGCVYEVSTISSMAHVGHIWAPGGKRAKESRTQFAVAEGDLITYLNVWRGWEENRRSSSWAYKNFIHQKNLLRAEEIRNQLLRIVVALKRQSGQNDPIFSGCSLDCMKDNLLVRRDLKSTEMAERIQKVRKALAAGLFLNSAELVTSRTTEMGHPVYKILRPSGSDDVQGEEGTHITIGKDSVAYPGNPHQPLICFYDAQRMDARTEVRLVHPVETSWLEESGYFSASMKRQF